MNSSHIRHVYLYDFPKRCLILVITGIGLCIQAGSNLSKVYRLVVEMVVCTSCVHSSSSFAVSSFNGSFRTCMFALDGMMVTATLTLVEAGGTFIYAMRAFLSLISARKRIQKGEIYVQDGMVRRKWGRVSRSIDFASKASGFSFIVFLGRLKDWATDDFWNKYKTKVEDINERETDPRVKAREKRKALLRFCWELLFIVVASIFGYFMLRAKIGSAIESFVECIPYGCYLEPGNYDSSNGMCTYKHASLATRHDNAVNFFNNLSNHFHSSDDDLCRAIQQDRMYHDVNDTPHKDLLICTWISPVTLSLARALRFLPFFWQIISLVKFRQIYRERFLVFMFSGSDALLQEDEVEKRDNFMAELTCACYRALGFKDGAIFMLTLSARDLQRLFIEDAQELSRRSSLTSHIETEELELADQQFPGMYDAVR